MALAVWPEWTKWGNKMLGKLRPSSVFLPSLHFVLKFVSVKSSVTECYFVWQLLMEALFFQEDAHSTYGHLKISSSPRWRKQFGIRWKLWNVRRLKSLQFFRTSLPSRSGGSNLKAFVCLFVQPIYFDYTVYSSEEGKNVSSITSQSQRNQSFSIWLFEVCQVW